MNFDQSLEYLYSFVDFERQSSFDYNTRTMDLDAFLELLERLGSPQGRFRIVHVAGTKGKGSTCAMIASALRCSGVKVGLFTSPHLSDVRERIEVNGEWISRESFASIMSQIKPVHTELGNTTRCYRTTFELLTAAALLHFAEQDVEIAVLETGLGGRLDSTNVVAPDLCVITRIGYDHTQILGETLSAIALEKAGIIKDNTPVVVAPQPKEALAVIADVARQKNCRLVDVASDFVFASSSTCASYQTISVEGLGQQIGDIHLPLLGKHQVENAACAVAALLLLSKAHPAISPETMRNGLSHVHWPGRVEVLAEKPLVVLDCAHNRESAEALVSTLERLGSPKRKIALVGVSANKEAKKVLALLSRYFDAFLVTRADTPRAMAPEQIGAILQELGVKYELFDHASDAAQAGLSKVGPEDLLCVTGSVYLAGELRPMLTERLKGRE